MMDLTARALKNASNSQKSRGGSIDLAAEDLDSGQTRRRRLPPPIRRIVGGRGRIIERTDAHLSLNHETVRFLIELGTKDSKSLPDSPRDETS
jgi:hypothetical protein